MSNSTHALQLRWLGVCVEVRATSQTAHLLIETLRFDFRHFIATGEFAKPPFATITVVDHGKVFTAPIAKPRLKFRGISVWFSSCGRKILYPDGCQALLKSGRTVEIKVSAPNLECAAQRIYLLTLSLLGEGLERNGYVRIHSAGFAHHFGATVLLAPSGTGKSTLASRILRETQLDVYSDEITLLRNGLIYPFPTPVRLKPPYEQRISIPPNRVAAPSQLDKIYLMNRLPSAQDSRLQSLTPKAAVVFIAQVTIGWHLPQLLEVALRSDSVLFLFKMLLRRLAIALQLVITRRAAAVQLAATEPGETRARDSQNLIHALSRADAKNSEPLTVQRA